MCKFLLFHCKIRLCIVPFLKYSVTNNGMILKSGLRGHWKSLKTALFDGPHWHSVVARQKCSPWSGSENSSVYLTHSAHEFVHIVVVFAPKSKKLRPFAFNRIHYLSNILQFAASCYCCYCYCYCYCVTPQISETAHHALGLACGFGTVGLQ